MSEGRKFTKTDSSLSPEDRLAVVEKNYAVILERIQAYDKVLEDFAIIKSDLRSQEDSLARLVIVLEDSQENAKKRIDGLINSINSLNSVYASLKGDVESDKKFNENLSQEFQSQGKDFQTDINLLKTHLGDLAISQGDTKNWTSQLDNELKDVKKSISVAQDKLVNNSAGFLALEKQLKDFEGVIKSQLDSLMNSFQNMPQFNEWATKIYIKVCNEISDRQKEFYHELDKRSQQLTKELASDPYTAESVKRMLREEIDNMSIDGKNAYIKATNASQQIQLLEKKVENINLILKKYELNK